jgi:glyoxylate reductase
MAKIYITKTIPSEAQVLLEALGHTVVTNAGEAHTALQLHTVLHEQKPDAVITLLTDKVDSSFFTEHPSVKIIANYAVGFNNIDVNAAKAAGVVVTNTPDVLTHTVAEHTLALMLAAAHRIGEGERMVRAGAYKGWDPLMLLGTDMQGKTLALVGAGRIGGTLATMCARGFNMKVLYYDVQRNEQFEKETGAVFVASVDELLPRGDFISIHVPLLDSTKHLINAQRLALMKKTAYIVNTSRGPVIDEEALVQALQQNMVAGAALDVYEREPELAAGLAALENVVLTPHTASATIETRAAMARLCAESIIAALAGVDVPHRVT